MKRILILGGGYVGLYTALGLQRKLPRDEAEITLVSPQSYMTYQPFLPEAAGGNIEPRHVVVPLRRTLRRTHLITGIVTGLDHARHVAHIRSSDGVATEVGYDIVILGLGSISRVLPVPGLEEHGVGFKSIEEAIFLRNHVLSRMDAAESSVDAQARRRALTFVLIGGGYSGVEALAELEDMARDAARYHRTVTRESMRWVLVEATDRILPEISPRLAEAALGRLRRRGIEVFLSTRLRSAAGGTVELTNGQSFETDTLIWTAGVRANPLLSKMGLPTDERGRVVVDEHLRVEGLDDAWAAGDGAAVPDIDSPTGTSPPTAQHALRQARVIARNVVASLRNEKPTPFRYRNRGSLVSLGRYDGVALIMKLRLKGAPAWFLHRTYHVMMVPTFNRKARVLIDWTVALFFKRDVVQLGSLADPRGAFTEAVGTLDPPEAPD